MGLKGRPDEQWGGQGPSFWTSFSTWFEVAKDIFFLYIYGQSFSGPQATFVTPGQQMSPRRVHKRDVKNSGVAASETC